MSTNCLNCNDTGWEVKNTYYPKDSTPDTADAVYSEILPCVCERGKQTIKNHNPDVVE